MQTALASVGGESRALTSNHEIKVCALRIEPFEAGERERQLRSELHEIPETIAKLCRPDDVGKDAVGGQVGR